MVPQEETNTMFPQEETNTTLSQEETKTMLSQEETKPTTRRSRKLLALGSCRYQTIAFAVVLVIIVVVIFAVTFSLIGEWVADSPIIDLGYAKYRGLSLKNGVSQWLGVPYAAAPVGDLRFAAPQDPPPADGIQDAGEFGSACISVGSYPIPVEEDEDCLFLNIFAPTVVPAGMKLPVYFFIQGGGFTSLSNPKLNGNGLIVASGMNIVIVTLNYRVGPYGFLASQEVEQEASLNNGLKDIIQALKWVQAHIEKFGGDPSHVTIGGDSAGGGAVTLLLAAYGGQLKGLFHAAAAESQSFASMLTPEGSQYNYNNLTMRTGCNTTSASLACLRNLDIEKFQKENIQIPYPQSKRKPLYSYGPTVDGELIPNLTSHLFENGEFLRLPTIFGDDTNEGTIFVPRNVSNIEDATTFIRDQFPYISPPELDWFKKTYLSHPDTQKYKNTGSYWAVTATGYGEMRYICPGIALSRQFTSYGVSTTWNYHYAVLDPTLDSKGDGTVHTTEVNAIWGPEWTGTTPPKSYYSTNADIVPVMQGYWTSFIRTYDPNVYRYPGSPAWGAWDGNYWRLFVRTNETKMEQVSQSQKERCQYLESIEQDLRQ